MSYYQYMVSVYRSCLPQLNRSLRSSSVTRMSPERETVMPARFTRANTVGPTSYEYTSAMPFTHAYNVARDRYNDTRTRLSSVERTILPSNTYTSAFSSSTSSGYSNYDYKVMDYASRLDREESTREYIDSRKYEKSFDYLSSSRSRYDRLSESPFRERYNYYSPDKHERNYNYDTYDIGGTYKHFRLSNQTLSMRNARAKSPIQSRELDRYFKTERRSSYVGDVSSGANRDFRYYSYRPVPYFGGSDHYAMTKRRLRRT